MGLNCQTANYPRSARRATDACTFWESESVNAPVSMRAATTGSAAAQPSLRECVASAVRRYLQDLGEQPPEDFYNVVLREVELPLLSEVMRHCGGNQSCAAVALGINRATLRKKLKLYGLG